MTVLIADEAMLSRLRDVAGPVEIRDPSGKVLGHYIPVLGPGEEAHAAKPKDLFDLEEAERILAAERDQGRPLASIWEEIRSLEKHG